MRKPPCGFPNASPAFPKAADSKGRAFGALQPRRLAASRRTRNRERFASLLEGCGVLGRRPKSPIAMGEIPFEKSVSARIFHIMKKNTAPGCQGREPAQSEPVFRGEKNKIPAMKAGIFYIKTAF